MVSLLGSALWMAPEVLQSQPAVFQSDIWSLGCVIIEMITGIPVASEEKLCLIKYWNNFFNGDKKFYLGRITFVFGLP